MISISLFLMLVILSVALKTLSERKIKGGMQRRIGPNKVGYLGLLQPFADGFKLILKETIVPSNSSNIYLLGAPYLFFLLALMNWLTIPTHSHTVFTEFPSMGLLYNVTIAELSIYGVLFSGWSANSIYPLIGALRSTAQKISYSISLSIIYISFYFITGSLEPLLIFIFQDATPLIKPLLPISLLFILSAILECNRAPADLPEAESELVSGFMTEHSAIAFAYFFLGEYTNMLFLSVLFSLKFLGLLSPLPLLFIFFWVRASMPRIRFDQLIELGWLHTLPFLIGYITFKPTLLYTFHFI